MQCGTMEMKGGVASDQNYFLARDTTPTSSTLPLLLLTDALTQPDSGSGDCLRKVRASYLPKLFRNLRVGGQALNGRRLEGTRRLDGLGGGAAPLPASQKRGGKRRYWSQMVGRRCFITIPALVENSCANDKLDSAAHRAHPADKQ